MSDLIDNDFEEVLTTGLTTEKFRLGQVHIAADTASELDRAFVQECLRRHAAGDWGDVDPVTAHGNERVLCGDSNFPIVSNYRVGDRLLQIATKADAPVTSIVLLEASHPLLRPSAWQLLPALEHVRATLKLRHLGEASDDEVEEALVIADAAIAQAKKRCG
jgi:hypothetical protein